MMWGLCFIPLANVLIVVFYEDAQEKHKKGREYRRSRTKRAACDVAHGVTAVGVTCPKDC